MFNLSASNTTSGIVCKEHELQCETGGECIDRSFFCDGVPDCRDGSDEGEMGCGMCLSRLNNVLITSL